MQENLQEMVKNLNTVPPQFVDVEIKSKVEETKEEPIVDTTYIKLINFYDWYEKQGAAITSVYRVKTTVSKVNEKDSMIFKVQKGKTDPEDMELISFYNPGVRPILDLPQVYVKIFKNDTFEVLHQYDDILFIKSYGVKNGLIVMFCANVDGVVVPIEKVKIKMKVDSIKLMNYKGVIEKIKEELTKPVDFEAIQLLYKQASKFKDQFTTKQSALDWFVNKQKEVIDINHLLKIDTVLLNII